MYKLILFNYPINCKILNLEYVHIPCGLNCKTSDTTELCKQYTYTYTRSKTLKKSYSADIYM